MKKKQITHFAALAFASATGSVFADFQKFEGDGYGNWQATGSAFGLAPIHGKIDGMEKAFSGYAEEAFAASLYGGNEAVGTLTSGVFDIKHDYLIFLVAGGKESGKTAVQLLVDGNVVLEATGNNSIKFEKVIWPSSKARKQPCASLMIPRLNGASSPQTISR